MLNLTSCNFCVHKESKSLSSANENVYFSWQTLSLTQVLVKILLGGLISEEHPATHMHPPTYVRLLVATDLAGLITPEGSVLLSLHRFKVVFQQCEPAVPVVVV